MLYGLQIFTSIEVVDSLTYKCLLSPMLASEDLRRELQASGRILYQLRNDENDDLGSVLLEEIVKGRLVDLTIIRPRSPKSRSWTAEEKALLQAQPDRGSRLQVVADISQRTQDERKQRYERILAHYEEIIRWFVPRLTAELEEHQALVAAFAKKQSALIGMSIEEPSKPKTGDYLGGVKYWYEMKLTGRKTSWREISEIVKCNQVTLQRYKEPFDADQPTYKAALETLQTSRSRKLRNPKG